MRNVRAALIMALCPLTLLAQDDLPNQLKTFSYYQPVVYTNVTIENPFETDMVSDGNGNHYVTRRNDGQIWYHLFDNKGTVERQTQFASGEGPRYPSITSYAGKLHVVFLKEINPQELRLWTSTDGGQTWTFSASQAAFGTVNEVDSYEDDRGVHITYGSTTGIYYYLRTPAGLWAPYEDDVDGGSQSSSLPSIVTTADSAHITGIEGIYSFKFPTTDQGAWIQHTFQRDGPGQMVITDHADPNDRFMYIVTKDATFYGRFRRYVGSDPWSSPVNFTNATASWKAHGVLESSYGPNEGGHPTMAFSYLNNGVWQARCCNTGIPWNTIQLNNQTTNPGVGPVIGANLTGGSIIWQEINTGKGTFRRKPTGIAETFPVNYTLSDTNWIIGTATVPAGVQLRLKTNSVTYVWNSYEILDVWYGPGELIVQSGGSIVMESGAKLFIQSGSNASGKLQLDANVVFTIPYGAYVEAQAGSDIKLGSGARIKVEGELEAIGTGTGNLQRVLFTRTGGSGTWNGIVAERLGIGPKLTLTYATIEHVSGTALRVGANATFTMTNSTISNANTGLEFTPTNIPEGAAVNIVSNSTISNVGIGILGQVQSSV